MHVMQRQNDACDEIMIFGVHGWLFKSFSLIKSWVQNRVSTGIFKDRKVKLAAFHLDRDVNQWWQRMKKVYREEKIEITWKKILKGVAGLIWGN